MTTRWIAVLSLLSLFAFCSIPARAADTTPELTELQKKQQLHSETDEDLRIQQAREAIAKSVLDDRYRQQLVQFVTGSMQHNQRLMAWQLVANKIILSIVILLVLGGFALSWLQFRKDANAAATAEASEMSFDEKGFRIRSSVLGLVVLFLSLGFFYLYVRQVYEVRPVSFLEDARKLAAQPTPPAAPPASTP